MVRMNTPLWITQFRKGLVELCVLATLDRGEAYGYQIVERLNDAAGLATTEGTVYPLLARLEREGLLSVRTGASPAGPPRRYYLLTAAGRQRLRNMARYWFQLQGSINHLVKEYRNDDGNDETGQPLARTGG
jgi:PadR family transcriptional regulator PadR